MIAGTQEQHRTAALEELEAELGDFAFDGLIELRNHLGQGRVLRGTWSGCVISYKRGGPGSARRDRYGRARNAFTVLWDKGWITDEEVVRMVGRELGARALDGLEERGRRRRALDVLEERAFTGRGWNAPEPRRETVPIG